MIGSLVLIALFAALDAARSGFATPARARPEPAPAPTILAPCTVTPAMFRGEGGTIPCAPAKPRARV